MITFSFEKDIVRYRSAWEDWKWSIYNHLDPHRILLNIHGFYGCGKREFIRQLLQNHKDISYFSFYGLNNHDALSLFCEQILDNYQANDWNDIAKQYIKLYAFRFHLLILDTENKNEAYDGFINAICKAGVPERTYLADILIESPSVICKPGYIAPRSLVDFMRVIPTLDKAAIVRLHGLTGGIPAVVKELDATLSFEDNLRRLLQHGSAYSKLLPEILTRQFRSPESYHPLMYQIALGKHRVSEIAKAVGFPNNKCDKYLNALIKAGLVETENDRSNGYSRYYLTNSYLNSWYHYIYRNQTLQIMNPQKLFDQVVATVDKKIAIHALHNSCIRYIYNQTNKDRYSLFNFYAKGFTKSLHLKHRDGFKLTFDCVIQKGYQSLLCVFPHSIDEKYTKDKMQYYITAAQTYGTLDDDVTLFVFSVNRFSDWCVHQAALYPQLFCVPMERLKY